jgi:enoyl-CoA hydratase/carnithine racemase
VELTAIARVHLPIDLDAGSMAALTRDLHAAIASPAPIVALTGAGAGTFCLGLAVGSRSLDGAPTHAFSDLLTTMHRSPKPLLAAIDGRAIGGGLGIACACDWIVGTDRSSFALPELLWGLVPAIIWPVLTDRMAPHVVRQWTLSAHSRTAAEASAAGLIDELVQPDQLERAIARGTRNLKRLDPEALLRLRSWARESRQHALPAALRLGADLTAAMLKQPSVQRRWNAFAEGDSPWSD